MRWTAKMAAVLISTLCMTLGHMARAETVSIPLADGTALKAELFLPNGPAVAPAIVALHGCGGAYPKRDTQWRDLLVGQGHAMLFPDSFGSRGLGPQCRNKDRSVTSFGTRRTDAIAAAAWLAARPGTPSGGVVLMGWSDGGSTVVATAPPSPDLPAHLLRGLIAFYPGCAVAVRDPSWKPVAPMLLLMGEADDWTPARPCVTVADRIGPPLLTMIAYPGAYHDFDVPGGIRVMKNMPNSQNADKTVHAGTDPAGQADALVRVPAFLALLPPAP